MKTYLYPAKSEWFDLIKRPVMNLSDLFPVVQSVFNAVQQSGDNALKELTLKFDKVQLTQLAVSPKEFQTAMKIVSEELKKAIQVAYNNILTFHESQRETIQEITTTDGVICWRESRAIEKVGFYIPGGTAPLFSTVLMLGIPAKIAGCKELVLCTPPDANGNIHPAILYTAELIGITSVFKIGGSQAIGALSFGTECVPKVDKIYGPGNQYVMAAKQLAQNYGIAIDMPAGPSEVVVIADETAIPAFVAADLLSQAEHGTDSQVILLTNSEKVADNISKEIDFQLEKLPRKELAGSSLNNSKVIVFKSIEECLEFSNLYAPEHLILAVANQRFYTGKISNAGSVFLGNYSCESAGDYASGTNHTLPTNGYAKAYSGVSLDSFVKKITFQEVSETGIQNIGKAIELMAEAEQLDAHKNAVTIRLNYLSKH
ncbi:MAG: histidinol dehydrogenase [Flavobacteriia bacterium]|nr:histidinol dehydrogenase [Flavobacteriia bacterium]OJX37659.1 MAG: histidinol dehydrogenase [Flavobacteriia bacterium 40-80]